MEEFKSTSIWKNTLGNTNSEVHSEKIEELRNAFLSFRKNTSSLVSRISSIMPGLTLHDISHLDTLWDISSLIVGDNYPLNPLEGFVLGGAILIHDSALCFEAYENGQDGVRNTVQWKDIFSELQANSKNLSTDELKTEADFIALRELHAIQAETILEKSWKDPTNGQDLYLLENYSLRKHLGKLIGKIASSHHWTIEELKTKLSFQQSALTDYPREWRIDPVKIACILRCADAAHIDSLRAPDFLHALIKRSGISFNHWQAQNKISRADIDLADPNRETLIFNSSLDFKEEDSTSWFIIYDAICLIDKELHSCNALLHERDRSLTFKVKRVKGAEDPAKLANYIKAENWKPCSAKVHVSNIEKLVENLGGEMLYGSGSDLLGVTLRELIQNSRDSILARSFLDFDYQGKISVYIEVIGEEKFLTIEDNGIGMSERVLTGPLLDFGTSFWTSSLIKSEFPGLRSSGFKSIGKFGIGFYSIFMIAESVVVESRSWKDGLDDVHQLKFNNGFTFRPILKSGLVVGFPSSVSTRIKLKLKKTILAQDEMVEIKTNQARIKNFSVPFSEYLAALTAGLDVDVYFRCNGKKEKRVHTQFNSPEFDATSWLNTISFTDYSGFRSNEVYIKRNVHRIKPIIEDGQQLGLAAISTSIGIEQEFLNIATVGGLAYTVHNRHNSHFIGYIDYNARSAKREIGNFSAKSNTIQDWAKNQLLDLMSSDLNPPERYSAASSLCHFNIDATDLAMILISGNNQKIFVTFELLAELSLEIGIAFLKSPYSDHISVHHNIEDLPNYLLIIPLDGGSFTNLRLDDNNLPVNDFSILDCLYRKMISKRHSVRIENIQNIGKDNFGNYINAIVISSQINRD